MTAPARVLIADDFPLVRSALATALATSDQIEVVGEAEDGLSTLRLARELRPDVLTLDIHMPDMDGLTVLRHLREEQPDLRILVVTATERPAVFLTGMADGAHGFVSKRSAQADLIEAVLTVHNGGSAIEPRFAPVLLDEFTRAAGNPNGAANKVRVLDSTERSVVRLVAEGLTDREIGQRLFVSTRTVQNYLARVRRKTGMQRRCELVRWASDNRWV